MLAKTVMIENGDLLQPFKIYKCDRCGEELPESAPRVDYPDLNEDYCGDCAFILGKIDEKTLLEDFYFWLGIPHRRVSIHNGKVYVGSGKFPWERTSRDRTYKAYEDWRRRVFERDDYTCQHCGKRGGELNAHHIKEYAKYPELRTDLTNGITLCYECHKKVHKKGKVSINE